MILPTSVSAYAERWNGLPSGTSMEQIGTSARTAMTMVIRIRQEIGLNIGCRAGSTSVGEGSTTVAVLISNLHAATFESEQPSRTFLNEQHNQYKHSDLGQHCTPERLDHFAEDPESHRANDGPGELADTS
jgi:hypothetical protein